ncbi:MAG: methyltransferase small, partial [Polaromonas sp.]|nr:methyltransferase small [Polaromonas sp.]
MPTFFSVTAVTLAEPAAPASTLIQWKEAGVEHSALWRSERGAAPPRRFVEADDTMAADTAYRLACEGTGLLWRGDFQNARQMVQALARRIDKPPKASKLARVAVKKAADNAASGVPAGQDFHLHRQAQSQRARVLGMVLIEFGADYSIELRRAPEAKQACTEAWGIPGENARQMVQALARRNDKPPKASKLARVAQKKAADNAASGVPAGQDFHLHRQAQSQRARVLGMVLIEFG